MLGHIGSNRAVGIFLGVTVFSSRSSYLREQRHTRIIERSRDSQSLTAHNLLMQHCKREGLPRAEC